MFIRINSCQVGATNNQNSLRAYSTAVAVCHAPKGPGAQPRLKSLGGPRLGSPTTRRLRPRPAKGRAGCWVREGSPPPAVRVRGYHPRKIFEKSDAKSCILVTTCCEISCFLKATANKLGDQYIVGPPT